MTYGYDTRSYNRSPERRENKRQCEDVTRRYLAGEIKFKYEQLPVCTCQSWPFPHCAHIYETDSFDDLYH